MFLNPIWSLLLLCVAIAVYVLLAAALFAALSTHALSPSGASTDCDDRRGGRRTNPANNFPDTR